MDDITGCVDYTEQYSTDNLFCSPPPQGDHIISDPSINSSDFQPLYREEATGARLNLALVGKSWSYQEKHSDQEEHEEDDSLIYRYLLRLENSPHDLEAADQLPTLLSRPNQGSLPAIRPADLLSRQVAHALRRIPMNRNRHASDSRPLWTPSRDLTSSRERPCSDRPHHTQNLSQLPRMAGYSDSDIDKESEPDLDQERFRGKGRNRNYIHPSRQTGRFQPISAARSRQYKTDAAQKRVRSTNHTNSSQTPIPERNTQTFSATEASRTDPDRRRPPVPTKRPLTPSAPTSGIPSKRVKRRPFDNSSSDSEDDEPTMPRTSSLLPQQPPTRQLNLGRLKQLIEGQNLGMSSIGTPIVANKSRATTGKPVKIDISHPNTRVRNPATQQGPIARTEISTTAMVPGKRKSDYVELTPAMDETPAKRAAITSNRSMNNTAQRMTKLSQDRVVHEVTRDTSALIPSLVPAFASQSSRPQTQAERLVANTNLTEPANNNAPLLKPSLVKCSVPFTANRSTATSASVPSSRSVPTNHPATPIAKSSSAAATSISPAKQTPLNRPATLASTLGLTAPTAIPTVKAASANGQSAAQTVSRPTTLTARKLLSTRTQLAASVTNGRLTPETATGKGNIISSAKNATTVTHSEFPVKPGEANGRVNTRGVLDIARLASSAKQDASMTAPKVAPFRSRGTVANASPDPQPAEAMIVSAIVPKKAATDSISLQRSNPRKPGVATTATKTSAARKAVENASEDKAAPRTSPTNSTMPNTRPSVLTEKIASDSLSVPDLAVRAAQTTAPLVQKNGPSAASASEAATKKAASQSITTATSVYKTDPTKTPPQATSAAAPPSHKEAPEKRSLPRDVNKASQSESSVIRAIPKGPQANSNVSQATITPNVLPPIASPPLAASSGSKSEPHPATSIMSSLIQENQPRLASTARTSVERSREPSKQTLSARPSSYGKAAPNSIPSLSNAQQTSQLDPKKQACAPKDAKETIATANSVPDDSIPKNISKDKRETPTAPIKKHLVGRDTKAISTVQGKSSSASTGMTAKVLAPKLAIATESNATNATIKASPKQTSVTEGQISAPASATSTTRTSTTALTPRNAQTMNNATQATPLKQHTDSVAPQAQPSECTLWSTPTTPDTKALSSPPSSENAPKTKPGTATTPSATKPRPLEQNASLDVPKPASIVQAKSSSKLQAPRTFVLTPNSRPGSVSKARGAVFAASPRRGADFNGSETASVNDKLPVATSAVLGKRGTNVEVSKSITQVPGIPKTAPLASPKSVPTLGRPNSPAQHIGGDVGVLFGDPMEIDSPPSFSKPADRVRELPIVALKNLPLTREAEGNAEPYFEYMVKEKVWSDSDDEGQAQVCDLSGRNTCVEDANSRAEKRFAYISKEDPKHKHIKFHEWNNKRDYDDCMSYLGTFTSIDFPSQKRYHKIWVERYVICRISAAVQPPLKNTLFINRMVYILRLFKLIENPSSAESSGLETDVAIDSSSSSDSGSSSDSASDNDPDKGKYKKKEKARARAHTESRKSISAAPHGPIRQHHPIPTNEIYTILSYANRAARRLQIDMSHEKNPSNPSTVKWQEQNARELEQQVNALERTMGGEERCWRSEFNECGFGGDRFELVVEKTMLGGPRNL